ncbi:putative glycogen storage control protein [Papiliotrema laurentii]|uniref:Glycogen storage control protein n=1 Tax=Papiliotrema laurentii TaxID=5418 RepID=A0AAD9CXM1_PAPLA|nr:putative glycogen storage control protein [Papiliotrema laurentii]
MNNQDASAQPTTLSSASTSTHTSSNGMTFSSSDTPSHATAVTSTTDTQRPEPEAGPSRPRSSSTRGDHHSHRPSSPETVFTSERPPSTPHLDLATYPTTTLLRLLANLLQQIAESNDSLRTELDDHVDDDDAQSMQSGSESRSSVQPHPSPTTALFHTLPGSHPHSTPVPSTFDEPLPLFTASKASLSHPSSLLSFHARHVPSISIEAYLLRILKYCPTTNEVFLGLLVYFDRMSRLGTASGVGGEATGARRGIGRGFAIDSYNVHRLVIAGVTVASKFFSDVFYTNSRYAKVGGLPPHELNQLELQFLLLNDFRLVIPPDEMQRYGDRLLGYWEEQEEKRRAEAEERGDVEAVEPAAGGTVVDTAPEPPGTCTPTSAPTPTPSSVQPPVHASPARGRERDVKSTSGGSVHFSEPPRPHHPSHGGLRSWVSGSVGTVGPVGGEVMTGRVASPLRD